MSSSSPVPVTQGQGKEGVVEPKKSARLAEKRKLREEAGRAGIEEDYYFTPLTRVNRVNSSSSTSSRQSSTSSPVLVKERLSPSPSFRTQVRTPTPTQRTPTPPLITIPEETATSSTPSLSTHTPVTLTLPTHQTGSEGEAESKTLEDTVGGCGDTVVASSNLTPVTTGKGDEDERPDTRAFGRILYINRADGTTLSFPPGMDYPLPSKSTPPPIPPVTFCVIPRCPNRKKYSCSTTKAPLCSLECYNKNLANHMMAMT